MGMLDVFLKPFVKALRVPVESFVRIETAADEYSLAAKDGSMVTLVRVDGARQIIGQEEYQRIITDSVVKIGTKFDRPGHAIQVYFSRNPERMKDEIRNFLRPCYTAARNIGLEIDDIFDERAKHLGYYLAWEEIYFVLWTRSLVLTKADMAREAERARERRWVRAGEAQYPFAAMEGLKNHHRSFVGGVVTALHEVGIQAAPVEVHDALRAIRANMFQVALDSSWRPCLPGDPIPARAPSSKSDMSDILWPPLAQQLAHASARQINDHVVEMGKYYWAGVDMILGPMDATPFPALLARLNESQVPFRFSYLIEGGGAQGMVLQSFLASIFSVTNASNKMIEDSIEGLKALSLTEPVVKFRASFCTWAPKGNLDLVEDRLSALTQALESWGYCQVSTASGDPLDQVMSSALGIHAASTAPAGIAPLFEIMKLIPWQRPSSPFETGSILFRTPDGRPWPYQTGTNVTTTWFDLVFAQPGGGKSVLMNTLNLGTCLTAGVSNLPFIAVIDIGPSSAGLISLIRDALPPHRRQEAVSYRLQMSQQFAINPFDTKLGMRYPQVTERSFLIELMTLLSTPPGQAEPYDGIAQLCGMVVDEMFRWRDDKASNAEPRPYLPRIDAAVDEAIQKYDIKVPDAAYWWDIVDLLFDKGAYYEAGLAQRYAMPTLGDSVAAARRPQIKNLLEETSVGSSSESVIHAFERMITSAVREFPILSTVTKFALNENRICALDLADVCPQGDATADRQTAVMYMLARHALVTPWWINEEALSQMDPKYRIYHEARLRDFSETPKRLCYDEFHRTSRTNSVRAQVVRDVREGRKRGIQIILASQMLDDFGKEMVDLATGVWVLGAAISDAAVDATQATFGLSATARSVMRHKLTGPKSSGAPALLVLGTVDGRYEQHLINTLGPVELWAFSTSSEDVAIRNRLYARLGAAQARRLLAANFPGGSARSEIRRRVTDFSDKGQTDKASVAAVIDMIVEELVGSTKVSLDEMKAQDDGSKAQVAAPAGAQKLSPPQQAAPAPPPAAPAAPSSTPPAGSPEGGETPPASPAPSAQPPAAPAPPAAPLSAPPAAPPEAGETPPASPVAPPQGEPPSTETPSGADEDKGQP